MTVDWDEELRKLNAGELDEKLKARDRDMRKLKTKDRNSKIAAKKRKAQDADPADWVKLKAREAQKAAQQTSYQVKNQTTGNLRHGTSSTARAGHEPRTSRIFARDVAMSLSCTGAAVCIYCRASFLKRTRFDQDEADSIV